MKHILIATFLFISFQSLIAQKDIMGKWRASCTVEKTDSVNVRYCGLCSSIKMLKPNSNTIDFELAFGISDVTIKAGSFSTVKAYEWNTQLNTIDFYFRENEYKFQILWTNDPKFIILRNSDNTVVYLSKK